MAGQEYYDRAHELLARIEAGERARDLAAEIGWQVSSVHGAVYKARHGKLSPPGTQAQHEWSPQMDAVLLAYWETENSRQLAGRLSPLAPGREITPLAVNARAQRLGLEKPGHSCDWHSSRMGVSA